MKYLYIPLYAQSAVTINRPTCLYSEKNLIKIQFRNNLHYDAEGEKIKTAKWRARTISISFDIPGNNELLSDKCVNLREPPRPPWLIDSDPIAGNYENCYLTHETVIPLKSTNHSIIFNHRRVVTIIYHVQISNRCPICNNYWFQKLCHRNSVILVLATNNSTKY